MIIIIEIIFHKLIVFGQSLSHVWLWPCGLQHARLLCPPLSLAVCSNSCILNEFVMLSNHLILCTPFSFYLQPFPASGCFPISQFFTSGGQSVETSASSSVLPTNIQGWFPFGMTGLNILLSKRLSRIFSSTKIWKHQFFGAQPSLWSNSHIHTWPLEKL